MTRNPPERFSFGYWERLLAAEGLAPLDDGRRMRQNPLRSQCVSEREAERLRVLAEILAWGSSDEGTLPKLRDEAPDLLAPNGPRRRADAFLALWLADGRRAVDVARERPDLFADCTGAKPVYERAERVRRLAAAIVFTREPAAFITYEQRVQADVLELFAEAQERP